MKKQVNVIIIAILLACQGMIAQEMNLDKILINYYKSNGIEKLEKVKTIVMSGTITRNDLMPLKITRFRPDKYRIDFELADLAAIQAYDGKTGWSVAPWTGNPKANQMDEETLKDIRVKADFDGILFKWKEKGHQAELAGKDSIRNIEVYKIKLTRKDGGIEFYYIDTKNFQLQKRAYKRSVNGQELEMAVFYRDYRKTEGISFPYINETTMNGQPYSLVEFEKVDINTEIDEKIFNMPQ